MGTNPKTKVQQLRSRIASGSVVLLSGSALAAAVNFIYNLAVAHFLGPRGFGHATAVYTLLTITSAVTLSFQVVTTKAIAQRTSKAERDAAYRYLHRSAWMWGGMVALVLIIFERGIASYLHLPSTVLVLLLALATAFYVPLGSRRGYIQGEFGFRSLATNLVLEGLVRLFGSMLMVFLGFGVVGVVAANVAGVAVAYLVIAPKLDAISSRPAEFAVGFRDIAHGMVFFSGQVLINNCDIVLVKHFFAPDAAGLYSVIAMVGRVTFALSSAVVNSMFPVVAGAAHEDRKNLSLIATALLIVLSVGSVFALALFLSPPWIWSMFFGSGFVLGGPHVLSHLLALYAVTTVIYSLSVVIISYEMSYKIAGNSWLQLLVSGVMIGGISVFHSSLEQVIMVQLFLMVLLLLLVAVPFIAERLRNSDGRRAEAAPLRLIRAVSEDYAIAEFLQSDFYDAVYTKYQETMREVVFNANLDSEGENGSRRALLYMRHRSLWKEIPEDTRWYEVELRDSDLERIRVFPRAQWRKLARGNFSLTRVADRIRHESPADAFGGKIESLRNGISRENLNAGAVLLIGRDEKSPLTILDGNHRFVAAVLEGRVDRLRFVCGLSPKMDRCCWYKTNLLSLVRYGANLLQHRFRRSDLELNASTDRPNNLPISDVMQ